MGTLTLPVDEYSSNIVLYMHENTIFLPGRFGGLDVSEIDEIDFEALDDEMGCLYVRTRYSAESYFFSREHTQRANWLVNAVKLLTHTLDPGDSSHD